jgi:hypothetical protein
MSQTTSSIAIIIIFGVVIAYFCHLWLKSFILSVIIAAVINVIVIQVLDYALHSTRSKADPFFVVATIILFVVSVAIGIVVGFLYKKISK